MLNHELNAAVFLTVLCVGYTGADSHRDCQEQRFPPYLWRQEQPPASHTHPLAANSPSASSHSTSGGDEGEHNEALPSSLSGMARHFQAQRTAQANHRGHLPTKTSRYGMGMLMWRFCVGVSDNCIVGCWKFRACISICQSMVGYAAVY